MTETKSPMRWKIIESVPDKNKIILLGVKESLDGDFSTRDDALAAIRYAHSAMASKQHEPSYQDLVDHIRWTQNLWRHGIEIMRKNNLVIASDTPMEKLAFTFYSDLCEIDFRALHLFGEGPGDENYKDRSAIQAREIVPYPRPYEEEIKRAAREDLLDILDLECEEIKSRIVSSAMGQPLSEESRGRIIGLLDARIKIKSLRSETLTTETERDGGEQKHD